MTVNPNRMQAPCDRPDCRHVRNLLAQSVPLTDLDAARASIAALEDAATAAFKALRVEAMTEGLSDDLDEAMDVLREVLPEGTNR